MDSHKVSIIIPAYNIEEYLGGCLDSVLAQTYKNIEVIVVNDGSKDTTGKIIDEYAKKDSRIIPVHKENGGVTSARFAGAKVSTGDYIGFVDGDDFIEPDMYERLVLNALKHNADISHCGCKMVFQKGHIDYYYNTGKTVVQDNISGINDLLDGGFVEPGLWNKLFSRKLILGFVESSVMDFSIKINEDLLMNYYLFKESNCAVYEDFCPYHYIIRDNSSSRARTERFWTDLLKSRRIIYYDASKKSEWVKCSLSTYVRALLFACEQKESPKLKNEGKDELRTVLSDKNSAGELSGKLKLMAKIAAFSPFLYRVFRIITDGIRGK